MFRMPLVYSLLLLLLYQPIAYTQTTRVQALTSEDGLSQDYVQSLFQDSRGFIWVGTFFGLNRYDGNSIKPYLPNLKDKWALHANLINTITEDQEGLIWIGTELGIAVLDPYSSRIIHLAEHFDHIPSHHTKHIFLDRRGNIWSYQEIPNGTLFLRFKLSGSLKDAIREDLSSSLRVRVDTLRLPASYQPNLKLFFLASDTTVTLADSRGNFFSIDLLRFNVRPTTIDRVARPTAGRTWYLHNSHTGNGLIIPPDYSFDNYFQAHSLNQVRTLPDGQPLLFRFFNPAVFSFNQKLPPDQMPVFAQLDQPTSPARLIDQHGNVWVGTTGYGLRKISIPAKGYKQEFPDKNFYNFALLADQKIWPGYFHHEQIFDLKSHSSSTAPWRAALPKDERILSVLMDKMRRTYFLVIHKPEAQRIYFSRFDLRSASLQATSVVLKNYTTNPPVLKEDSKGGIWIASQSGEILRYDPSTDTFKSWDAGKLFPKEMASQIHSRSMEIDRSGRVWISCDYGLIQIDPTTNRIKTYFNSREKTIFSNNGIFCAVQDPYIDDILWLGALGGGLVRFDIKKETTSYFTNPDGPSFQVVTGIVQDQNKYLWLATNLGIFCFDPAKKRFLAFEAKQALSSTAFNASAFGKTPDGRIAFGNVNGLFLLEPSVLLKSDKTIGQAHITRITVNNQILDPALLGSKLTFSPSNAIQLELSYKENNLNIAYAAPNIQNVQTASFRYRLKGVNDNWANIGAQYEIPLFGLRPGAYTLEIQPVSLGLQQRAPISQTFIHIAPPWYLSKVAYLCYTVLCLGFLFQIYNWNKARVKAKQQIERERQEAKRIQSLDDFKNNFFAYIAHEIKTPLTIIRGIIEQIRKTEVNTRQVNYLNGIQKESENLLELVDEMIDVTRLQDKTIKLFYEHRDILQYLRDILHGYQPLAELKQINLDFQTPMQRLDMDFDPLRTKFILKNLLLNAIRHTPSNGIISVNVSRTETEDQVIITVSDTGEGIPPEDLPLIFKKYFQASPSKNNRDHFGLGLTFSKNLITLLQGNISVESTVGKGTTFTVMLPVTCPENALRVQSQLQAYPPVEAHRLQNERPLPDNAPWLLIVEDNPSILSYLQTCLQPFFHLLLASDGKEGIDIAVQKIPDLILTDMVMPVLDGLEFTHTLKQNTLTNHIPIVMLSAKTDLHDRLKAQQQGADLYLSKPFHSEELILALQNLYRLQQNWKGKFTFSQDAETGTWNIGRELPGSNPNANNPNDSFMEALLSAFEANYASESFDMQQLCKTMHLSKTQLYRKLSAISDQSAMELLRNFRLQKAAVMLQNNPEISIKEISLFVGIKELSHFSNLFKKKYGKSPSEMRKKQ